jgi:N-formylglutamate deformylase
MKSEAFQLVEPTDGDSPVVVEVPHAGLWLDAEAASWINAPARCIARDADLYVDELFAGAPSRGATLVAARVSRYVVDLNRGPDDYDGLAVEGGPVRERPRGVIWRLSSDGIPVLRERLTVAEYERRMDRFHRPYHQALESLLQEKRARFGFAVLLCAHSMPTPRTRVAAHPPLADIVPGTRGRSTAAECWIDLVDAVARGRGFQVQHDVPYRGGFSTGHYGRPEAGWHAVQVEIARRLYMDERRLGRDPVGFSAMTDFALELVSALVERALKGG